MPKIILARHGQTIANRDGLIMGQSDSPLTEQGRAIVEELAGLIGDLQVGVVFASPLGRAVSTANLYGSKFGLTVAVRNAMAELACGAWEGKSRAEVLKAGMLIRNSWVERPPRGESYADAEARVLSFIEELRERRLSESILVVGHAGVNRVFLKLWLDLEPEVAMRISFRHDTAYAINEERTVSTIKFGGFRGRGLLLDGW